MGLIDFKAALSPVNPTLSNGLKAVSIDKSAMVVAPAIGIADLQTKLGVVTVLDAYGRDFSGSLAALVVKSETTSNGWLRRRLQQMQSGGGGGTRIGKVTTSIGFASVRTGPGNANVRSFMTSGSIGYHDDDIGVTVGFNAQDSLQSDIMGLAPYADGILAYAPQAGNSLTVDRRTAIGRLGLTLATGRQGTMSASAATVSLTTGRTTVRASWINEDGSVLGAAGSGALNLGRGSTTAMIEAKQTVGLAEGWALEGYGSIGVTRLKIDPTSVVTSATPLVGSRFGLLASGPAFGGSFSFGIAQPLTIEAGTAYLTLGSGYDLDARALLFGTSSARLASGTRRIDATMGFTRSFASGSLRLGAARDMASGDTKALLGWSSRR
jgi:hypothetical protein